MFILASNGLGLREVAPSLMVGPVLGTLAHHVRHSHWEGCTAWDLVQPAFLFMVGLAMPYSYAARAAQGDSHGTGDRQHKHLGGPASATEVTD